ncbi:MAG: DUF5793 family protein [Halorhabdus sp.]
MNREQFTVNAVPARRDDRLPTLEVTYDGSAGELLDRLSTPAGDEHDRTDVDVALRLREGADGVLSVADRFTGAFVCEVETETSQVTEVIAAAEDDDGRYRLAIEGSDETWAVEKRTLLVYDEDGHLLRGRSLIPGSVEL